MNYEDKRGEGRSGEGKKGPRKVMVKSGRRGQERGIEGVREGEMVLKREKWGEEG